MNGLREFGHKALEKLHFGHREPLRDRHNRHRAEMPPMFIEHHHRGEHRRPVRPEEPSLFWANKRYEENDRAQQYDHL